MILLFGKLRPYLAKVLLCEFDGRCSGELLVLKAKEYHPGYLQFLLLSDGFIKTVDSSTYGAKMPRAEWEFIGNMKLPVLPISSQVSIFRFLSKKIDKIERIISLYNELIRLLKEKRQSTIDTVVCKGLHLKVPMKDTGIKWIGTIPNQWKVIRLRFTAKINPSKLENVNLDDKLEVSFLPMESISEDGKLESSQIRHLHEIKNGFTNFQDGDILVAKITPCFENGKGALCSGLKNGVGYGTTELHVIRASSTFNSQFLYYWTRTNAFRQVGKSTMFGSAGQKRIPIEFILDFKISYPESLIEQKQISDFLDSEVFKIDSVILKIDSQIERLKEFSQSLVSSAVTGKIDLTREVPI